MLLRYQEKDRLLFSCFSDIGRVGSWDRLEKVFLRSEQVLLDNRLFH